MNIIREFIITHPIHTMIIYLIGVILYVTSIFFIARSFPRIALSSDPNDIYDSGSIFGAMPGAIGSWIGLCFIWLYVLVYLIIEKTRDELNKIKREVV
jgi:hypothetical protein